MWIKGSDHYGFYWRFSFWNWVNSIFSGCQLTTEQGGESLSGYIYHQWNSVLVSFIVI